MPKITAHEIKTYVQRFWCDCGGEFIWTHRNRCEEGGPYKHIHRCDKCSKEVLSSNHCYPEHILVEEGKEDAPIVQPWQGRSMPQILIDEHLDALMGGKDGD